MLALSLPEERRVEASNLTSLLSLYLSETKKRVAYHTFRDYAISLSPFTQWWEAYPAVHQHQLSEQTFANFLDWYADEYRPPATESATDYMMNKTTVLIRRLLRWMHNNGAVSESIMGMCPIHQYHQGAGKYYPTIDDVRRMFDACSGISRLRDAAMLSFMIETGARRFEVANVQVSDLKFDRPLFDPTLAPDNAGYVHLRITKNDSDGRRGGRYSVFSHMTALLLKHYLLAADLRSGSLFGMKAGGIWHVVRSIANGAELPDMHPHAFRSLFIDWYVEAAADGGMMADMALRLQVGHALGQDVTTAHYIDTHNREKIVRRIRSFYTSPMLRMEEKAMWDWQKWVFVTTK